MCDGRPDTEAAECKMRMNFQIKPEAPAGSAAARGCTPRPLGVTCSPSSALRGTSGKGGRAVCSRSFCLYRGSPGPAHRAWLTCPPAPDLAATALAPSPSSPRSQPWWPASLGCVLTLSPPSWDHGHVTRVRNLGGICKGHPPPTRHSHSRAQRHGLHALRSFSGVPWLLTQEQGEGPPPRLIRNSHEKPTILCWPCSPHCQPISLDHSME